MSVAPPHVELVDLSFAFGHKALLRDVNMTITRGERLALMGQSGVGKTTLCRLMAGLLRPTSGRVLLNGEELHGPRPAITASFQHYPCFPWLTVEENVRFGVTHGGDSRRRRIQYASELLDHVGLGQARRLYPHQLSGGMLQRLSLARALAVEPEVLLLDEPFSALDVATKQSLIDLLLELHAERRFSLVVVLHSIEDALAAAQRVAVLVGKPASVRYLLETKDMDERHLHDALVEVMNAAAEGERPSNIEYQGEKGGSDAGIAS